MTPTVTRLTRSIAFLVLPLFAGAPSFGASAGEKCESAKLKFAGKYAACLLKAESKAAKTGGAPDYSKCDRTYVSKWQSIESKAGAGVCPSEDDQLPIAAFISVATEQLSLALGGGPTPQCPALPLRTGQTQCDQGAGPAGNCPGSPSGQDGELLYGKQRHYTDNSDGTITDHATALSWEKLSDDSGIHDKDNTYTWDDAFAKVATLNSQNFAGHNDWRLPNRFELETLIDLGRANPAIPNIFNVACIGGCTVLDCSCTRSTNFASSTSYHNNGANTWYVSFFDGNAFFGSKTNVYYVRAVRGGS